VQFGSGCQVVAGTTTSDAVETLDELRARGGLTFIWWPSADADELREALPGWEELADATDGRPLILWSDGRGG
jgi:hypothetical protein